MKAVRDRTKLVPKVIVDKNGVSRKVFVNPDDNRTSKDKVISVKEQSSKFRKGTVIEVPVRDSKTNKLKTFKVLSNVFTYHLVNIKQVMKGSLQADIIDLHTT